MTHRQQSALVSPLCSTAMITERLVLWFSLHSPFLLAGGALMETRHSPLCLCQQAQCLPGADRHHQLLGVHIGHPKWTTEYTPRNICKRRGGALLPRCSLPPRCSLRSDATVPLSPHSHLFWLHFDLFPLPSPETLVLPKKYRVKFIKNLFHIIHSHLFNYTQNYSN